VARPFIHHRTSACPSSESILRGLTSIQVLRALAAIGVVLSHIEFFLGDILGLPRALKFGEAGVDLFFVISGFIIVYTSKPLFSQYKGAQTFFVRRLIRIVPLYWAVTTLYIAIRNVLPTASQKEFGLGPVIKSYLFFPYQNPNGDLQPILGQGWTLNYEMLFYTVFAFAIFMQPRKAVALVSLLFALLICVSPLLEPLPIFASFWSDPIILEFVFGMFMGLAYLEGVRAPLWLRLPMIVLGTACSYGLFLRLVPVVLPRPIAYGIPAAMIMFGAVFGASWAAPPLLGRIASLVGDASYALYLVHALPIRAVREFLLRSNLHFATYPFLVTSMITASAILIAIVTHIYFERPITQGLRRRLSTRQIPFKDGERTAAS
jgi:exopolysaccharide production protein ExoZ